MDLLSILRIASPVVGSAVSLYVLAFTGWAFQEKTQTVTAVGGVMAFLEVRIAQAQNRARARAEAAALAAHTTATAVELAAVTRRQHDATVAKVDAVLDNESRGERR